MARLSIIATGLPLLALIGSTLCASYQFGGTFGLTSKLNLTSTGFGTLKKNDTTSSGIGGTWEGEAYGGGYGNKDNIHAGAIASAKKVVSLKPGDNVADIDVGKTTYRGRFFFSQNAKRNSKAIIEGDRNMIRVNENETKIEAVTVAPSDVSTSASFGVPTDASNGVSGDVSTGAPSVTQN